MLPQTKAPLIAVRNQVHVSLAPQPKAAFVIASAKTTQTQRAIAAVHFGSTAQQGSDKRATVAAVGFGSTIGRGSATHGTVAATGLGRFQQGQRKGPTGRIASVAFASQVEPAAALPTRQAQPLKTSVIVLFGPKPIYTQEARQLHIQGTVVLRVTVTASGQIKVLSVIHGLGHGLDEAAEKAVTQYQVKPATQNGVPVSVTTDITITFQLA
jgi:TonB family protein